MFHSWRQPVVPVPHLLQISQELFGCDDMRRANDDFPASRTSNFIRRTHLRVREAAQDENDETRGAGMRWRPTTMMPLAVACRCGRRSKTDSCTAHPCASKVRKLTRIQFVVNCVLKIVDEKNRFDFSCSFFRWIYYVHMMLVVRLLRVDRWRRKKICQATKGVFRRSVFTLITILRNKERNPERNSHQVSLEASFVDGVSFAAFRTMFAFPISLFFCQINQDLRAIFNHIWGHTRRNREEGSENFLQHRISRVSSHLLALRKHL